jgi:TonB family protein
MLFRRLLETNERSEASRATRQGLAISAAAHIALVGGSSVLGRATAGSTEDPAERVSMVEYLVPEDQLRGSRAQEERVTFATVGTGSGSGYLEDAERPRREEQLELEVDKGAEKEMEAAKSEFEDRPPLVLGDSIMTEIQVDSTAMRYDDSAAPAYPAALLRAKVEGVAIVQYVVDTLGRADTATFRVVTATHPDFARAVRDALPGMRFRPAMMASRRVPQLVQQPFAFKIVDTTFITRGASRPPPG